MLHSVQFSIASSSSPTVSSTAIAIFFGTGDSSSAISVDSRRAVRAIAARSFSRALAIGLAGTRRP